MRIFKITLSIILIWGTSQMAPAEPGLHKGTIEKSVKVLEQSLKTKSFQHLKPYLSGDFAFSKLGGGGWAESVKYAQKMIEQLPYQVKELSFREFGEDGPDLFVWITLTFGQNKSHSQKALLSKDGKFLELTFPEIQSFLAKISGCNKASSCQSNTSCGDQ